MHGIYGDKLSGQTVVVNKAGRLGTAPTPAAPLGGPSETIKRLRDRVGQLAGEVRRLQKEVRAGG